MRPTTARWPSASAGVLTDPTARRAARSARPGAARTSVRRSPGRSLTGDPTSAVEIAASLRDFWHTRGHLVEARQLARQAARGDRGTARAPARPPAHDHVRDCILERRLRGARRSAGRGSGDRTGNRGRVAACPGISGPRLGNLHGGSRLRARPVRQGHRVRAADRRPARPPRSAPGLRDRADAPRRLGRGSRGGGRGDRRRRPPWRPLPQFLQPPYARLPELRKGDIDGALADHLTQRSARRAPQGAPSAWR